MDAALSVLAKPAIQVISTAALTGWRKARRYFFSPTILIAGQNSSGKTTLRDYFVTGYLPDKALQMPETMYFASELVEMSYENDAGSQKSFSFWIRDSRGFFDASPIVNDVDKQHPAFIYIFFDIRRFLEHKEENIEAQIMKYGDPVSWTEKFLMSVRGYIKLNSTAKRKLAGAAAIINKSDLINEETFTEKKEIIEKQLRPLFKEFEPYLGFGETHFDIFYTTMIRNKQIARADNKNSDLGNAISFMISHLILKKAIS